MALLCATSPSAGASSDLLGAGLSAPTPNALAAAVVSGYSFQPIIGPGGWLIGNGLDAPADCTGAACNGGNGGLLWGGVGNGANGGMGGNAVLIGNGGAGGIGVNPTPDRSHANPGAPNFYPSDANPAVSVTRSK